MANSAMVLKAVTPDRGCSQDTFTTDHAQNARERTRTTPTNAEDGSDAGADPYRFPENGQKFQNIKRINK